MNNSFLTPSQSRFRYLERPSQFGGTECFETLWEKLACPNATTECRVTDYCGESFTCKDSGKRTLTQHTLFKKVFCLLACVYGTSVNRSISIYFQGAASASPFAVMEIQTVRIFLMKMTVKISTREKTSASTYCRSLVPNVALRGKYYCCHRLSLSHEKKL